MATRKGKFIEHEPAHQAMSRAPIQAAPHPRGRERHDLRADGNASSPRPVLRLVKSPKSPKSPKSTRETLSAAVSSLAAAVAAPATQLPLPLRFPQPLVALPAALTAPIEHIAPARPAPIAHPTAAAHATPATLPAARPASVRARFGELRAALAEGFEIVQPIFARPLWSVGDDSTTAFNFVLRRERTTRLVTVPEGRTVQRFIRERQLLVDYRH